MNDNFLNIFCQNLIKEEFSPINFYFDNENILCFIKQLGNNIYFISPININKINYKDFSIYCENYIKNNISNYYINKIFFLEVLISEFETKELNEYITYNSNLEENIINLKWFVNIGENKIVIKGNQATKLLNISKIINNSFNSNFDNKSIYETLENQKIKKINSLKSKNINLTIGIIFILCFIHFYIVSTGLHNEVIKFCSTSPNMLKDNQFYRIFTSTFLHSNFYHLASNCLSLYIFGSRVERYLGKLNFLIIYFIGIICSSLFSHFINFSYSIGASGAIFALEGAILCYSLKTKQRIDGLDYFVFITLSVLGISSGFINNNVDNAGHIGGFVSGIIISYILSKNLNNKKI